MSHPSIARRAVRAVPGACLALLLVGLAFGAARAGESAAALVGAKGVYTRVNLHPDPGHSRLYAANFQQAGLIPVCSRVEWLELDGKTLRFRVLESGHEYEYRNHKAAGEPFAEHLLRFFGRSCPSAEIRKLGRLDQQGIREGRALVGMTRRGVEIALGPPPLQANPGPKTASSWLYWKSRFDRFRVSFGSNGRVTAIQD